MIGIFFCSTVLSLAVMSLLAIMNRYRQRQDALVYQRISTHRKG